MRALICGSRTYSNRERFDSIMELFIDAWSFDGAITLISGGATGPDSWTVLHDSAKQTVEYVVILPDWEKHGRAAGPIRNQRLLDEGKPDLVIAFWDGKSRGTLDMITRAVQAGVEVRIFGEKEVHRD